jgi:peptidoglycan hydrolase CwlO-like protein
MIPITVSAYKKHDKLLAIVSTSFLTVLISISIFANYQYVTNLTIYKNDSKKIVSSEYEKLNQDQKIIESKIESHGSEIKKIDPKIESLEKKLNQKLNQKNEIIESKKALTSTESNV